MNSLQPFHSFAVFAAALIFICSSQSGRGAAIMAQAESATRGADFAIGIDGSTQYLYSTSSAAGNNPGSAARVATFTVTFPEPGAYDLYARIRVGAGSFNDDSFFYANGFGNKSATSDADWILVNNTWGVGYTASGDVVGGGGSAGVGVWKWINLSEFNGGEAPITFTVTAGNLTQTFQLGAREDGLFIDTLVFGTATQSFTVAELDAGGVEQPPVPGSSTIYWNYVRQRIDGFGASSAWRSSWSVALADLLFSTNNNVVYTDNLGARTTNYGVGLSLLRTRIVPGGTTVEQTIMQYARDRGAKIWSAPWSPAAQFKSNGAVNGGSFVGTPANYQAYATQLAGYVHNMKAQFNIDLYALSVQNEPDADVTTYESCNWTAQQIHDFVPYLYNALQATNAGATMILLPESQNWPDYQNLADTAMNDVNVAALVGIVANHNYDGAEGPTTLAQNNWGKPFWQTEVSILSGSDSSINNGVYYARRIYQFMTVAEINAWHYWWLVSGNTTGNQGLLDNNGSITKRLFTHGNYSRFVRPGFYHIGANSSGALVSAFKQPNSLAFAIVAINPETAAINQTFTLNSFPGVNSVTPWITSATLNLAPQTPVAVTNQSFTFTIPAMSVVTFAGQASGEVNVAPAFTAVPDQVIDPGVTLTMTNVATDPDVPPQVLTYSLLTGPADAEVGSADGVFTWRPPVSHADTINAVSLRVQDNGSPALSATNNFTITVNPLTPAMFSSIELDGGQVSLMAEGPSGPDYTLLTSTNLVNWELMLMTNSPVTPFLWIDTNAPVEPSRFYRIELGP